MGAGAASGTRKGSDNSQGSERLPADEIILSAFGETDPRELYASLGPSVSEREVHRAEQRPRASSCQVVFEEVPEEQAKGELSTASSGQLDMSGRRVVSGAALGATVGGARPGAFWKGSMVVSEDGVLVFAEGRALVLQLIPGTGAAEAQAHHFTAHDAAVSCLALHPGRSASLLASGAAGSSVIVRPLPPAQPRGTCCELLTGYWCCAGATAALWTRDWGDDGVRGGIRFSGRWTGPRRASRRGGPRRAR